MALARFGNRGVRLTCPLQRNDGEQVLVPISSQQLGPERRWERYQRESKGGCEGAGEAKQKEEERKALARKKERGPCGVGVRT